jgi:hypothetical protein
MTKHSGRIVAGLVLTACCSYPAAAQSAGVRTAQGSASILPKTPPSDLTQLSTAGPSPVSWLVAQGVLAVLCVTAGMRRKERRTARMQVSDGKEMRRAV